MSCHDRPGGKTQDGADLTWRAQLEMAENQDLLIAWRQECQRGADPLSLIAADGPPTGAGVVGHEAICQSRGRLIGEIGEFSLIAR